MGGRSLQEQAEALAGRALRQTRLVRDTSEFMDIGQGDVLELEGRRLLVLGNTYEGRFGLDNEPKHWVKRGLDWATGRPVIVKLVFFEEFNLPLGPFKVRCYRSPAKESRILALVEGHPSFMQGQTLRDEAGNQVRVLERIHGHPLDDELPGLAPTHEAYFEGHLKAVLRRVQGLCEAIAWLHRQGERHGDIRRDHVFVDQDTGHWRWIDFDYNFEMSENPFGLDLFGLGNVLIYAVAQGDPTVHGIRHSRPELLDELEPGDFSLVIKNRLVNLRKLHPYLPLRLNRVLMHFAASAPVFYTRVEELLSDLAPAVDELPGPEGGEGP